jgi:acylphosphatase
MARAVIILKGDFQHGDYRTAVQKIAKSLNIVGYVEKLTDDNLKIVCEGERYILENFIEKIKVIDDFTRISEISVEYDEPTGEFDNFDITLSKETIKKNDSGAEPIISRIDGLKGAVNSTLISIKPEEALKLKAEMNKTEFEKEKKELEVKLTEFKERYIKQTEQLLENVKIINLRNFMVVMASIILGYLLSHISEGFEWYKNPPNIILAVLVIICAYYIAKESLGRSELAEKYQRELDGVKNVDKK